MNSYDMIQISVPKLLPYKNYPYTDISCWYRDIGLFTVTGVAPFTSNAAFTSQRTRFRGWDMCERRLFTRDNWENRYKLMGDELKIGWLFLR